VVLCERITFEVRVLRGTLISTRPLRVPLLICEGQFYVVLLLERRCGRRWQCGADDHNQIAIQAQARVA